MGLLTNGGHLVVLSLVWSNTQFLPACLFSIVQMLVLGMTLIPSEKQPYSRSLFTNTIIQPITRYEKNRNTIETSWQLSSNIITSNPRTMCFSSCQDIIINHDINSVWENNSTFVFSVSMAKSKYDLTNDYERMYKCDFLRYISEIAVVKWRI